MNRCESTLLLLLATTAGLLLIGSCKLDSTKADETFLEGLLLTEVVVTPTAAESVEIHNPTSMSVDLSNYYISDSVYNPTSIYYYNVVTGSDLGGEFGDFTARFPDSATIASGEYQTISLAGSDDYFAVFGVMPTYELFEDVDGGVPDGIPDMREAISGSIDRQGGLGNDGESVIFFFWDQVSDLVADVDIVVWGDKEEAIDKTGVVIDGPDANGDTSEYLADTAIASQDVIDSLGHADGMSWQRTDMTEGSEHQTLGNGQFGSDETSENLSVTWSERLPTPNAAFVP